MIRGDNNNIDIIYKYMYIYLSVMNIKHISEIIHIIISNNNMKPDLGIFCKLMFFLTNCHRTKIE